MDILYTKEKAKLLKMQANYLRYLASVYPQSSPFPKSVNSSPAASMSPQRSSNDRNPHDDIPVKKVQKKFEELLEEQLQKDPNSTPSKDFSSSSNPHFLKRGEGHLCTYTRSQSSSQLKTLRNRFTKIESPEKIQVDLEKISMIKEQLQLKNNELKKEEKELQMQRKVEMEELSRIRKEKSRERKTSPYRDEVESLKKIIKKMEDEDKIKEARHQEEVRKLNIEILKLRQKVAKFESTQNRPNLNSSVSNPQRITSLGMTPVKRSGEYQGKIQKFVEKNKMNIVRKIRKENILFDQFDCLSFDSRE